MSPLRIVFMGTPELAATVLRALLHAEFCRVVSVATQPDRPKGRDLKLQASPVKLVAERAGLPVLQPERARHESFLTTLREFQPDLVAVAAFGQILPQAILDLPQYGCLNVHTSLLPKYRGAAPIQWALANGDPETGVTIMKMDAGLDTGAILTQRATPIRPADNGQTLHDRLALLGAELLVQTIPEYVSGHIPAQPQDAALATHAAKIKKSDGQIDWQAGATAIWNRLRAFTPWPGAYTFLAAAPPVLLKIWEAEPAPGSGPPGAVLAADRAGILVGCGKDALRILNLQREGGRRLTAAEFLAGHPLPAGTRLGAAAPPG